MGSKPLQKYKQTQAEVKRQLAKLAGVNPAHLLPLFTVLMPALHEAIAGIEGLIQKIRTSDIFQSGRLRHKVYSQPEYYDIENYPALEQGLAIALSLHSPKVGQLFAEQVYTDLEERLEVVRTMEKALGVRGKPTLAKELTERKARALAKLQDKSPFKDHITGLVTALLDEQVASTEKRGRQEAIGKAAEKLLGLVDISYCPGSARKRMSREK
jgi:hypothetical protein